MQAENAMKKKDANSPTQEPELKVKSMLSREERRARASAAAKAMWEKKRKKASGGAPPEESVQAAAIEPATVAQSPSEISSNGKKIEAPPLPKEFSKALAAAEKQYAKAIQDLAYHEEMAVMLRSRIPFLAQAIRALGGVSTNVAEANGAVAVRGPEINYPPPENLPVIPVARGGSMGVINDAKTAEDENQFLRDAEGVGAGGGWQ